MDEVINSEQKILYLASVDFSHYLIKNEADKFDAQTLKNMKEFDVDTIMAYQGNDNLDSPQSIVFLLNKMKKEGIKDFEVMHNLNSADITNTSPGETTSYFVLKFVR